MRSPESLTIARPRRRDYGPAGIAATWCRAHGRTLLGVAALAAVLAVALTLRLTELNDPTDNYDEGVYLAALFLVRNGFRPFADINTGEGPLNLYLAFGPYALGGFTLEAARTGTALVSMLGILGAAWAGRALGGSVAGLGAALVLAISPAYLRVSRWVGPEAMATAFALLAVAAAVNAYRTGRDRDRVLSGGLFALANLIQASLPTTILPIVALTACRTSRRSTLLAPLTALAVAAVVLLAVGPAEVLMRVVSWRLGGQQLSPTVQVVGANAEMLLDKMFRQEQPALYALGAIGGLTLFRTPRLACALLGWLGAQLGLLLVYTELSSHLGVTLLAPLALLAGLGLAQAWAAATQLARRRRVRWLVALPAISVAIWYLSAIPALLERNQRLIANELSSEQDIGRDEHAAVRAIARLTGPDDFVLTDQPYLAFLASRKVPPDLVDPSTSRIEAGTLTGPRVIETLRQRDVPVVVLWTGKLVRLPELEAMLRREYELVETFGRSTDSPRAIYRRRGEAGKLGEAGDRILATTRGLLGQVGAWLADAEAAVRSS